MSQSFAIRVAAAALNQTPLDWDGNEDRIRRSIRFAREHGVQLLCLPELCVTGYGCEDAFHSAGVIRMAWSVLEALLPEARGMVVAFGLPVNVEQQLFNCAALVVDGHIAGLVGKQNLASEGIHYEPRWFRPWPNDVAKRLAVDASQRELPIGDLLFDCSGVKIGFEICEDAWVLQRPGGDLARLGVDVILNPSASHFAFGKHRIRERIVQEASRAFRAVYVYANLLGNEAGRAIYDGDCFVALEGETLAEGVRFGFQDFYLTVADVDLARMRSSRIRNPAAIFESTNKASELVQVKFDWTRNDPTGTRRRSNDDASVHKVKPRIDPIVAHQPAGKLNKFEEFTYAETLGLFDYLRKSQARGCVVSMSGGADSSAVATLVTLTVRRAIRELGLEKFKSRFAHDPEMDRRPDEQSIINQMLVCVYQSTENSSETTAQAAEAVALGLGATFFKWSVQEIVDRFVRLVSTATERVLSWATDDVPLQNVQARARAPGVWLLANLRGALLLSTSNRSEAAVGYTTMDGDTCGGLAPIAGIDKAFLMNWLRWMETTGPQELGAIAVLSQVNCLPPTAELRPPSARQTDEDDLMPYVVLDAIERAAIRDKLTPSECLVRLEEEFAETTREQRLTWVDRFFRLWCRNQWKRERYAPSFHLDDKNLDPKTWCRFPILSGGFARELRQMHNTGP